MAAPEFFLWGASRGQNAILRGQKSKNLPKMADFGHFFLLTGGQVGGQSLWLGGICPPCPPLMPPLFVARIRSYITYHIKLVLWSLWICNNFKEWPLHNLMLISWYQVTFVFNHEYPTDYLCSTIMELPYIQSETWDNGSTRLIFHVV